MADPVSLEKYQILVAPDSKKTQGLQTGDIVRRQYFDGANTVYSLMCVLSYGTTQRVSTEAVYDASGNPVFDADGNIATQDVAKDVPYFIGALLEGDAPKTSELLDFARVTNLFNQERSGALYLTASDSEAPFMDVIDGIGRNKSLCWPDGLAGEDFEDARSQYVVKGDGIQASYKAQENGQNRIARLTCVSEGEGFCGLSQDFYELIPAGRRILVSYKARASRQLQVSAEIAYSSGAASDAEWTESLGSDWKYFFQAVSVINSGRHLRTFKLGLESLGVSDWVEIADFNIILLDSIANFGEASSMRVGKLDGVSDPVFGKLTGYGAYIQKLYASQTAHISGTLTAGDENGFASTFYAGKIHRNCFKNSCAISFGSKISLDNDTLLNPTGMGNVYRAEGNYKVVLKAQDREWLMERIGQRYCFSFWCYSKNPCSLAISQNGYAVKTVQIASDQTHEWRRVSAFFDLMEPSGAKEVLLMGITLAFSPSMYYSEGSFANEDIIFITAPQLEKGESCTQYQPTDDILNETEDYGAWFARGGIGGTIQNPLLRLNYDGSGAIDTRTNSFRLNQDGSGFLANRNIMWDSNGKVTFGSDVTLNWDNLDDGVKQEISYKAISISGADTFTIIGSGQTDSSPVSIILEAECAGFESPIGGFRWYYNHRGEYVLFEGETRKQLEVLPFSDIWDSETTLIIKCEATVSEGKDVYAMKTLRKQSAEGLTVVVTSSNGEIFKNNRCQTTLTATVYYNGVEVTDPVFLGALSYSWYKVNPEGEKETLDTLDTCELELDYSLENVEKYGCEIYYNDYFNYIFPLTLE